MEGTVQSEPEAGWLRPAGLLVVLVSVLAVPPFLPERLYGFPVAEGFLFLALLAGVASTSPRRCRLALVGLAVFALAGRVSGGFETQALASGDGDKPLLQALVLVAYMAFFALVGMALGERLLKVRRVSVETLCTAFSLYLLLGFFWTAAFALLEFYSPQSFTFTVDTPHLEDRFDRFLGFSFTTLTTLGYGNISPATPRADALAILEAIAGQAFLAIVIARLVSLQLVQGDAGVGGRPE